MGAKQIGVAIVFAGPGKGRWLVVLLPDRAGCENAVAFDPTSWNRHRFALQESERVERPLSRSCAGGRLAGLGSARLRERVSLHGLATSVVAALLLWQAVESGASQSDFLAYFNQFAG